MKLQRSAIILAAAVVLVGGGAAGYLAWQQHEASLLPAGIVSVNGRVEATQVDISTKIPGRVVEIVPHEGDMVSPGEVVARIDTSETLAQFHQAQASAELARKTLTTREAEVASDEAQQEFASEEMRRTATLVDKGWSTHEQYDQRRQQLKSAGAALKATQSQIEEAIAAVKTADAKVEELQAVIDDSTVKSPVRGRVQYRLVEPGAVLPPGGKIATVIDLSDVYTTIYLPVRRRGGSRWATTRAWWWTRIRNTSSPPRSRSWRPNRNSPPRRSRSSLSASSSCFASSCRRRFSCSRT
jgi:HlyD family secretion protein